MKTRWLRVSHALCTGLIICLSLRLHVAGAENPNEGEPRLSAVRVAAGSDHTVLIKDDGTLWGWGRNSFGQLGDGTVSDKGAPVQIGESSDWVEVSAGDYHTVGLKHNGTIWAWGRNSEGQLGNGTNSSTVVPVQIGQDTDWLKVSSGGRHTVGLKRDGTLWAWGDNGYGQLGDGTTSNRAAPVQIDQAIDWVAAAAGNAHSVALKSNGTLWAWGRNSEGQLGDGTNASQSSPIQIGKNSDWAKVAAGNYHATALKVDGTLWAWGSNDRGQLGDGTSGYDSNRKAPVQIGIATDWVAVAIGGSHTVGMKSDKTLWAWGNNSSGQFGDGTFVDSKAPIQIDQGADWLALAAGDRHTVGLKRDGTLWAWGNNGYGEYGNGSTVDVKVPIQIGQSTEWDRITAGDSQTVAVKTNGTLWAWGYNYPGQLGDGTTSYRNAPAQIGQATDWVAVTAGGRSRDSFTLALKADGTLWAWGDNSYGQLGLGPRSNISTPLRIGQATDWMRVVTGDRHTVGLKSDGTLWAWGANSAGQLGDGGNVDSFAPVQVGQGTDWVEVAAGYLHNVALKSDGTLWAWGANYSGQLGDGTTSSKNVPIQIGHPSDWIAVTAGNQHSVGVKSDGTLWAWGSRRVVDGTPSTKNTPELSLHVLDEPPSVTEISGKTTSQNVPIGPIKFALGDADTALDELKLTVESSNSFVAQSDGLSLGGSGAERSLTINPMPDAVGRTTITVVAYDGSFTARTSFELTVKPGNDDWTEALELRGLEVGAVGVNGEATKEDREPNHASNIGGKSVWWRWTAQNDSLVTISTKGSDFDTSLGVYTGESVSSLNLIAENDNTIGGNWSYLKFRAQAGITYWVAVDGIDEATGNIRLELNAGEQNRAPMIAGIGTHLVGTEETLVPVGFLINDAETAASELIVTANSSNHGLVPNQNIELGGSGSNRTFMIKPVNGQTGTTTVTVQVADEDGKTASGTIVVSILDPRIATPKLAVGGEHSVFVRTDGTLWAWGYNRSGELGDGVLPWINLPVQIGEATDWIAVVAGGASFDGGHTVALKRDGTLWAWGRNNYGQLGDGFSSWSRSVPFQIGEANDWVSISAGDFHTAGLKSDGTLWAWGFGHFGELGYGSSQGNVPRKIGEATDWMSVSAGDSYTAALKSDGTLWTWGYNVYGELGDGSNSNRGAPFQIGDGTDWAAVAAGKRHTMGLKSDGTLWAWGDNSFGQLGNGSNADENAPVQVGTDTDWIAVAAGDSYTVAQKSDGTLWGWGRNISGQVGDGTNLDRNTPVQIDESTDWLMVEVGGREYYSCSMGLKSDGTLWTWGSNHLGWLDNAISVPAKNSPVLSVNLNDNPPQITAISRQSAQQNFRVEPIEFTVADADTPLNELKLMAVSSKRRWVLPDGFSFSGIGAQRTLTITLMPNAVGQSTITVLVYDGSFSARTSFELVVAANPLEITNDDWNNALEVSGTVVNTEGSNIRATKEESEPNHGGNPGGHSVWWSWTPARNGPLMVSTEGSSFNTTLAAYTGTSLPSLKLEAENNSNSIRIPSRIVFNALAGVTYWIAVDGSDDAIGDIALSLTQGNEMPRLEAMLVGEGEAVRLTVPTETGFNYVVESSDSVAGSVWHEVSTVAGDGSEKEVVDNQPRGVARFYRISIR